MNTIILQLQDMGVLGLSLFVLFAAVVVFLAVRELMAWYWKINQIIENQNETNRLLSEILKEYRGEKV